MHAVILAGGKGTRMRPYSTVLPKPLLPVGQMPILELIVRQLAAAGFKSVDLSVGHLGGLIQAYMSESSAAPSDVRLRYFWEEEPLGTAGALRQIMPEEDAFLVMNGDILTALDYRALMEFHRERDAALTIATHRKDVPLELGVIEGDGVEVSGYTEKPTLHYRVSAGIYVYSQRALAHIPESRFDFPDLVLALLAAGEPVASYSFDGPWYDIGTLADHERAMSAYHEDPSLYEPGS